MISGIRRLLSVPELKQKIAFTLLMLVICRIGAYIPVPGINGDLVADMFRKATGGSQNLFQLMDVFSGGAFAQMTTLYCQISQKSLSTQYTIPNGIERL